MAPEREDDSNGIEIEKISSKVLRNSHGSSSSTVGADEVSPLATLLNPPNRERPFSEIQRGDRAELHRIASGLASTTSWTTAPAHAKVSMTEDRLARKDTVSDNVDINFDFNFDLLRISLKLSWPSDGFPARYNRTRSCCFHKHMLTSE